jgi:hypothetical protein
LNVPLKQKITAQIGILSYKKIGKEETIAERLGLNFN